MDKKRQMLRHTLATVAYRGVTHIGQIAMLRRLAESLVRGESYAKADIAIGARGARPISAPPRVRLTKS